MRFYRVVVAAATAASMAMTTLAAPAYAAAAAWVPSISNPPQGWTSVDLFTDGTGYVHRTEQSGTYFWKTTDGGVTYAPADVPPGFLIDFATAEIGYAASLGTLWRTADGAGSWTVAGLPTPRQGRGDSVSSLFAGGGGNLVALGIATEETRNDCPFNPFTQRVEAAVTADAGATWERVPLLDEPGQLQMIEMLNADFGVAVVSKYDWTRDGACSFEGTGTLGDSVYVLERDATGVLRARQVLDCRPRICGSVGVAAHGAFTVGYADGGVGHTTDGGATFAFSTLADTVADTVSETDVKNTFWVTDIEFANATVGYAVTNGRGMWRTDDGGATWVSESSTRGVYDLGIADLGVADAEHALAGGPTLVVRRQPLP